MESCCIAFSKRLILPFVGVLATHQGPNTPPDGFAGSYKTCRAYQRDSPANIFLRPAGIRLMTHHRDLMVNWTTQFHNGEFIAAMGSSGETLFWGWRQRRFCP